MDRTRRSFLGLLGVGAAAAAIPVPTFGLGEVEVPRVLQLTGVEPFTIHSFRVGVSPRLEAAIDDWVVKIWTPEYHIGTFPLPWLANLPQYTFGGWSLASKDLRVEIGEPGFDGTPVGVGCEDLSFSFFGSRFWPHEGREQHVALYPAPT